MNKMEKAKLIVECMDEAITISSYMEEYAIKAVIKALNRIQEQEKLDEKEGGSL